MKNSLLAFLSFGFIALASAEVLPPPVIRPVDLRADEQPIAVTQSVTTVEENAFFRRVKASFVFTNPNARTMQGDFEFPIPEDAFVCGYALEVNGELVPGVVCEKEKARVAFENEVRKGVDPGLVEQVKGNLWKTRIFPLNPNQPRRAEVEYVCGVEVEKVGGGGEWTGDPVFERDGDDIFVATTGTRHSCRVSEEFSSFSSGVILWDASLSRLDKVAADRAKLATLPETGDWRLIVFANEPEAPLAFTTREALLAAVDAVVYDGGTDLAAALKAAEGLDLPRREGTAGTLLFSDEIDTLGDLETPRPGTARGTVEREGLAFASRPAAPVRVVEVRKVGPNEKMPRLAPKPSTLLATVWAARRMQDLASQADVRKDEFLALGRKYGVAGPGLSLIVLETLQQWLDNKIEPPANLAVHAEWLKRRAAEDDPIAAKKAQAEFETQLLRYWEERVTWWKSPKPKIETPKSGLFDRVAGAVGLQRNESAPAAMMLEEAVEVSASAPAPRARAARSVSGNRYLEREAAVARVVGGWSGDAAGGTHRGTERGRGTEGAPSASVTLKAWDPKTPYVAALKAAEKGAAYQVYLKERAAYKDSPAFYLDCADFFFAQGEAKIGRRVISNLAEFKLENPALWRTMGWRLRQAGEYDFAVRVFRKVLTQRGEEGLSWRDLGLVLMERGKRLVSAAGETHTALATAFGSSASPRQICGTGDLAEAAKMLQKAAFTNFARRSTRRGNDFQVAIFALEELNGLLAWCATNHVTIEIPQFDAAYRRDLPVGLRIVLAWDADETDIDLHVLEPNGEEAYYGHRRTAEGGFVSEDVTTGYGPEEYLAKDLQRGVYKVLTNYFASHQTTLTGATTVQATVYTNWGQTDEKMQILTLRLDKPKDKVLIGEIAL